jgi:hypothetical protein
MAYVTYSNVQTEFKNITFGSTTFPTSTTVTTLCDEEGERVDTILGAFITTPVSATTSPNFYKVIQRVVKMLVKHRIENIINTKTGAESDQDQPPNLEKLAKDELREYIDNRTFSDAVRKSTNEYGASDYNYTNDIEAEIDVAAEQW